MKQMPVESFFLALGNLHLCRDAPHLRFVELAYGKQGLGTAAPALRRCKE